MTTRKELESVRENAAFIKERCGREMDYGSDSDGVHIGYVHSSAIIATLDRILAEPEEELVERVRFAMRKSMIRQQAALPAHINIPMDILDSWLPDMAKAALRATGVMEDEQRKGGE